MAGRKRKPDHLKVVAGTAQPCRMNPDAPAAHEGMPTAPAWLSERAAQIFAGIAEILDGMGIASPDHSAMLALLASRLEDVEATTAIVEDLGRTYATTTESGSVMYRTRPEVGQRNVALKHAQSLLAEFGLSPSAISSVSVGRSRSRNPFLEL